MRVTRTTRALCLAMVALFLNLQLALVAETARAQTPRRRVAVFVHPATPKDALHAKVLQTLLRRELAHFENLEVATGSPLPAEDPRARGATLVEDGYRAIHAKDKAKAAEAFQAAHDLLTASTAPLDARLLARAVKGLAVAHVLNGRTEEARRLMRTCLFLWPAQKPDEYLYAMEARDAFKSVQGALAEEAAGQAQVSSEPQGAGISVDGVFRGYAPDTVSDLAPGKHLVEVQLDGFERAVALVEVPVGAPIAHTFTLQAAPGGDKLVPGLAELARKGKKEAQARPLTDAVRALVGSEGVLALQVQLKAGSYVLTGWYGTAEAVRAVDAQIAQDAQAIVNLRGLLATTLGASYVEPEAPGALDTPPGKSVVAGDGDPVFIDPNDPIFKEEKKEEGMNIVEEWWFWTIIGAVAVGLVVGGVFLFQPEEEGKGPVGTLEIQLGDPQ